MSVPQQLDDLVSRLLPLHGEIPDAGHRHRAAVLVLLFPRDREAHFILTERLASLSRHAGQISLPGGGEEPQDTSLLDTALRETQEEIGLRTGRLRPLGHLTPIVVNASNYLVVPFVAWNPVPPRLRPDPGEVERIFEVPLDDLLKPERLREETWELRGKPYRVTFYDLGGVRVWGATARILGDLAARLRRPIPSHLSPAGSVAPVQGEPRP